MRFAAAVLVLVLAATPALANTLAAGGYHTCAVDSGHVVCWGDNRNGQLGDGTLSQRAAAVRVKAIDDAIGVAAGSDHACAVRKTGALACWGDNSNGQLGDGTTTNRDTPVAVAGITDAVEVAAGQHHTCARRASNAVVCWGDNTYGQLGDGSRTARKKPTPVLNLGKAAQISAAGTTTCARTPDGVVACWGNASHGETGLAPDKSKMDVFEQVVGIADGPTGSHDIKETVYAQTKPIGVGITDAIDLATGHGASCVVRKSSAVTCWGYDLFGILGTKKTIAAGTLAEVDGVKGVTTVAVGEQACARFANGAVTCWGLWRHYETYQGQPSEVISSRGPTAVPKLADVTELAVGDRHACARRKTDLACWGDNQLDQLGTGQIINDNVGEIPLVHATALAAGAARYCALEPSGKVACWPEQDAVGNPPKPVEVAGISDAVALSGSGRSWCVITKAATLRCWSEETPAPADKLDDVAQVDEAFTRGCAVKNNAEVWCWEDGKAPAKVAGFTDPVQVSVGSIFACVREKSGRVQCWGDGQSGELGDGKHTSRDKPAPVSNLTDATSVVAGSAFACAIRASREVVCWGDAHDGGTGTGREAGTGKDDPVPVKVVGLTDAVAIVAQLHACALRANGTVWCWGANNTFQLGRGSGPDSSKATEVVGIVGATAIAAGLDGTCVVMGNTHVWCWDVRNLSPTKRVQLTDTPSAVAIATP